MISKIDERKKWKNVNTEESRMNYRRLRNKSKIVTENAKKEYVGNICKKTMEYQETGRYNLIYMKTKELGWKETQRIQNIDIEDFQRNRIVDQIQMLKIWENYITELYDRPNRPETLEAEPEEEVETGDKGPYVLHSEVAKAIKEMRNKKAAGDDDVHGGAMMKLINTIYETGEWSKDFTEVTMIALKKKPQNSAAIAQSALSYSSDSSKGTKKENRKED